MKLITKEVAKSLPALYETEHVPEERKLAVVKFFNPCGSGTWYAFEANAVLTGPEEREVPLAEAVEKGLPYADVLFFGYVTGLGENELGYFSLRELESVKLPFGLGIERDLYWTPTSLAELRRKEVA